MSFSGTKGRNTKPKPGVQINPSHPLSRGLVGYWLFNEGSGSLANDISGYSNHARLTNMSPNVQGSGWGGSKFGGGLHFDGVNDVIATPIVHNYNLITLSTLLYMPNFAGSNGGRIFDKESNFILFFSTETEYTPGYGNNDISFYHAFSTSQGQWYTPSNSITENTWHHILMTYDATNTTNNPIIYIDGILQTLDERTTPIGVASTNAADITIGNRDALDRGFESIVDTVCIYDRILPEAEVKQLYHDLFCNLLQIPIRRYSVVTPVGAIMTQFQRANIGADLYNGVFA